MAPAKTESLVSADLQKEGNACFSRGDFDGALRKYAAALASPLRGEEEKERHAQLRSNRSLCCLRLGQADLALAEADKCKELRPDWPKAYYRRAAALEALDRLGDARLTLFEAKRLSPSDTDVEAAIKRLSSKLFTGDAARVGEALDVLEDFQCGTAPVLAAARDLHELVVREDASGDRRACIEAFVQGGGAGTIFRRQNAMGPNWQEECKNGTMSLLSKISIAVPQLDGELLRLNREAEAREEGHEPGVVCKDRPSGPGLLPPPAPLVIADQPPDRAGRIRTARLAKPLGAACNFAQPSIQSSEGDAAEEGARSDP